MLQWVNHDRIRSRFQRHTKLIKGITFYAVVVDILIISLVFPSILQVIFKCINFILRRYCCCAIEKDNDNGNEMYTTRGQILHLN